MVRITQKNLKHKGSRVYLSQANVETLPYADSFFNTIVNTMAFTGYPDAHKAMSELRRVLKPGGKLVMVDIAYPKDGNWPGLLLTRFWITFGDLIRDMDSLFKQYKFEISDREIGGFGSVHLFIATKCE